MPVESKEVSAVRELSTLEVDAFAGEEVVTDLLRKREKRKRGGVCQEVKAGSLQMVPLLLNLSNGVFTLIAPGSQKTKKDYEPSRRGLSTE